MGNRTDYTEIAGRYDRNKLRHQIAPEPLLQDVDMHDPEGRPVTLDIACGTGNWLLAQSSYYKSLDVDWIGIDASPEMLAVASKKLSGVRLIHGQAESLPFDDAAVDFAVCNYALHHVSDHHTVIGEAYRVLKPGARFVLVDIVPEYMEDWWVYRFFPSARGIDSQRFITQDAVYEVFRSIGFETEIITTVRTREQPVSEILDEALNRDVSQLTLVDDEEYQLGIEQIKRNSTIADTTAHMRCVARVPESLEDD
jgi:ubiquinone/menaquinone biosynthesis C-methylase UbiE